MAGRIRLATGRVPAAARALSAEALAPPDSALARAAEEACGEQPGALIGHGYRTWMFGSGLAALDRNELDAEQFYAASLLHDYGISAPVPGEDFTLRSVDRLEGCAHAAGLTPAAVGAASDAITVHSTPGINLEADGPRGVYVQAGAMLDLAGLRAGDLTAEFRRAVICDHPRAGVTGAVLVMIRAEANANPDGRFGLLQRCGLPILIKLNPLRPK